MAARDKADYNVDQNRQKSNYKVKIKPKPKTPSKPSPYKSLSV